MAGFRRLLLRFHNFLRPGRAEQELAREMASHLSILEVGVTAPLAALGLYLFGQTTTPMMWYVAAALLAVGTAFWWPAMLGITSERFPAGGALLLAIIGASGSFSTAIAGPVMGWINETYGARAVLPTWAILPVALTVIFAIIVVRDRAKGGYRVEQIQGPTPAHLASQPATNVPMLLDQRGERRSC
jgi:MFS family permease